MQKLRLFSLMIVVILLVGMIPGCGTVSEQEASEISETSTVAEISEEVETEFSEEITSIEASVADEKTAELEGSAPEEALNVAVTNSDIQYPLEGDTTTLSFWTTIRTEVTNYLDSYSDHETWKAVQEATNVSIDFIEVSQDANATQFSLMVASGDYPDMISQLSSNYTGGTTKAFEDDVIIPLNDYLEEYAPNYWATLNEDEDRIRDVKNDDGLIGEFVAFKLDINITSGHMIRSDWLDELGLDVPTTYDELEEVLLAFKNAYNCSSPYLLTEAACPSDGLLAGGYGIIGFTNPNDMDGAAGTSHLFCQDGVVKSSLLMDEYKEFLIMLNRWYNAGLISSDFATISSNPRDETMYSMISGGDVGVWCGACENVSDFEELSDDDDFSVLAISEFKLSSDDTETNHFGSSRSLTNSSTSIAISTQCAEVETAVMFLNFFYTEDGMIYANYGVQGYAWEYDENGNIARTELITNNPDVREDTAVSVYASISVPTVAESSFNNNWSAFQIECINLWNSDTDGTWLLPDYLSLSADETDLISSKLTDVNTYAAEHITKFINGDFDIETEWESFQETLIDLGIEDVIEIYQEAVDRYHAR